MAKRKNKAAEPAPSSDDEEELELGSVDEDEDDEEEPSSASEEEVASDSDVDDDSESNEVLEEGEQEIRDAMLEYMNAEDGKGDAEETDDDRPTAVESDSSEDEAPPRNTIGDIPLQWYKDEEHIGYTKEGHKLKKRPQKDHIDSFLAGADDPKAWRKVYDEENDEVVELTKDEIGTIARIRQGKLPHAEVNPYEPYVDWFDWDGKGHPLSNAPEPKRRFVPSKWEAKKVVKLVRALRKGWIKLDKPKEKPRFYMMWGDDTQVTERTANGLAYIPAPNLKLPGHEESYNPPIEYIPTEEEINSYKLMYEEDRPKFIPQRFDSLRQIPAYADFIRERFERCLDLYLCPRTRKKRINIDPDSLLPKLPKAKDLQPYPIRCYQEYRGHAAAVSSISTNPSGEWLASGSRDGTVRLWEISTGRCKRIWEVGVVVRHVAWNPNGSTPLLAVAVDNDVVILDASTGSKEEQANVDKLLSLQTLTSGEPSDNVPLIAWTKHDTLQGIKLSHQQVVDAVSWHHKGDYFVSVCPDGVTKSVLVHQLSKQQTQNPFRKHHGRVVEVLFHPVRPFLFVATKTHVRVYNLAKQQLSKKLVTGLQEVTSMAVHSGGDNVILGSAEAKLCWFDMDLSSKPYKTIKNHQQDIRAVAYHRSYPLFASCSDDGSAHVFHGMVYSDLMQNPLIVPLKVLRGHQQGILDIKFHPKEPWLFTAGGDTVIKLFCD